MAKICPEISMIINTSPYITSKKETFTIWMKSLVFHGNGCTVFNSKGEIAFRIDNYQERCSSEVSLMDPKGQVLFSIKKQKLGLIGRWNIYKCGDANLSTEGLWFKVKKIFNVCHINLGWDKTKRRSCYKMMELNGESSALKIIDNAGELVAELSKKQATNGVQLGEDVLSLEVESNTDYSLIMAFVAVHGLIHRKL